MKKDRNSNPVALVPILVFLVLYLGTGIIFEYVMKIPMGFYNVPIIVAFMAAILVACMQNSQLKFDEKNTPLFTINVPTDDGISLYKEDKLRTVLRIAPEGRSCRKKQCRECSLFYVKHYSCKVCSSGTFYCCLLCIYCNGYICWNNNTYYTNSGCGIRSIRI